MDVVTEQEHGRADRSWRPVALLVAGAFFMEMFDGTVIATVAPSMAVSLGVRSVDINVTMTVYLVTLAVFIPVSGWAADRFGGRTVFATAIAVFTVASALCAMSGSLGVLTAMRALQGIGGAMMVPVGRLIVLRRARKSDVIHAIAYLTWPGLVAPIIAPVLGGVLATYASWRWIFLINVPLGVIALLCTLRMVSNTTEAWKRALDWTGFLLLGAGLALFLYGVELINGTAVRWRSVLAGVVVGGVLLALAVGHLMRREHPLVDLRIMSVPTFRITNRSGSLFRIAVSAVPYLLPLMFQDAFGWTPLKSGLMVIAVFAGNLAIKPLTTPLLQHLGFRTVLLVTGIGTPAVIAACGLLSARTPLAVIAAVLFVSGVFRSVGFTAYSTIVFADVEPARLSDANTLSAAIVQLSSGLGVAIGALALRLGGPLAGLVDLSGGRTAPFSVAYIVLALIALVPLVEAVLLPVDAGSELSSRRSDAPSRVVDRAARRSG